MIWALALLGVALMGAFAPADAANCALRNPDRQIREIFGANTSYRTEVAAIDDKLKQAIEKRLGSPLSMTDVGKHTAYVVLQGGVPVGFVHARTETGSRGSVELIWAMDLNLNIKDFRVQRSREPHTDVIDSDGFRQKMVGRDIASIRDLLTKGNTDINLIALGVPESGRKVARAVVVCGLKTRLITEMAFGSTVGRARLLGHVHRCFPETASVKKVNNPYPDAAAVGAIVGAKPDQCERSGFTVLRSLDSEEGFEGILVSTVWAGHNDRPETWWAVSPDGEIQQAWVVGEAVTGSMHDQFTALRGSTIASLRTGGAPAKGTPGACGLEVLAVLAAAKVSDR